MVSIGSQLIPESEAGELAGTSNIGPMEDGVRESLFHMVQPACTYERSLEPITNLVIPRALPPEADI